MNQKRVWHIVRIVVIIIVSIPILFISMGIYKAFIMDGIRSSEVEDYISGRYLSFPGGNVIDGCIPAHEELGDYKALDFGYFDGRRKNFMGRNYYISFGLRVRYSEEEYLKKKQQADTNNYTDYPVVTEKYKFIPEGNLNHVLYGAEYIDTLNMIEYVAICVDNGDAIVHNGDILIQGELSIQVLLPLPHASNPNAFPIFLIGEAFGFVVYI